MPLIAVAISGSSFGLGNRLYSAALSQSRGTCSQTHAGFGGIHFWKALAMERAGGGFTVFLPPRSWNTRFD